MALIENSLAQQASLPITQAEALGALNTGVWGDEAALKLVVQDTIRAESYESSKQWIAGWNQGSALYQSPYSARYWEGTSTERSSISFFTVASAVNSLVPQIINGLFFENPPFMVQERSGTTEQEAAAVGDVLAYQLEDTDFREELRLGVINGILFGTNIWKWGWESFSEEKGVLRWKTPPVNLPNPVPGAPNITVHSDEDELEEEVITEYIDRPVFEHIVNLRHVLVDPTLNVPDISKAKYVIHRMYMTWEDLDKLRDRPGYDIPTREQLLDLFLPPKEPVETAISEVTGKNPQWDMRAQARYEEATVDPFQEPLEVLERWSDKNCIVVLQKKAVIYNGSNDYGKIPFLSVGWWDVPEAFYSMGLAKTIGAEQRLQQGIVNTWLDNAALNLNGVYTRVMGNGVPTQSIRIAPGKVLNISKENELVPLERLPAVPEAGEHISMSQARVDQLAGAGALNTSGSAPAHSNLARSATGANMLANSSTTAPDFVEKLANQVIVPLLYNFHQMNYNLLPPRMLRRILNDELQHEYTKNNGDIANLYNAKVKFSILAGSKMQVRRQMSAQLPIIIQFLTSQQTTDQLSIAGYRVDVVQLMRDMYEASDWKDFKDVVVKMTPEEQKRADANSPAAKMQMQVQAQQQMQQQKHNDQLDIVNEDNIAKAGREVLRHALENSETPQVLTGEAGASTSFTQ